MDDGSVDFKEAAAAEAWSVPVEQLNPAQAELFVNDAHWPLFDRLRKESPIHWTPRGDEYDGFWSISRYQDIMAVDTNHEVFSSADGIVLQTLEAKAEADKRPRGSSLNNAYGTATPCSAEISTPLRRSGISGFTSSYSSNT